MLGLVLISYSLNALFRVTLPELAHPAWAVVAGVASGVLAGAYAIPGPPIVIYGNARRWLPTEFKANLQGFFLVVSVGVILSHLYSGNLTTVVWEQFALSLIPLGLGIFAGTRMDRFIDVAAFNKIVLWLLLIIGIRLFITHV